ncbi:MAG: lactate racemase domain-containing protein [Planctomycetaceae bacterium]
MLMTDDEVRACIEAELDVAEFSERRVLLIVPDATRTVPLPLLFSSLHALLQPVVRRLDVLVALGTHPPMSESAICQMLGISGEDRNGTLAEVGLYNHEWDRKDRLTTLGTLTAVESQQLSNGLLSCEVDVSINSRIHDYDVLLVVGPVFPHEVVGFSGGNKYFFPGISGPELLNFFHWLGALITNVGIIGNKQTAVRRVVDRAASMIPIQRRCLACVVDPSARIHGLFYGTAESAWERAADLSAQVHIKRCDRPFQQVLSCAPPMYDELWVAGKCMYKLEAVVADGGELIIFAPHLNEISTTHGDLIEKVGYHVRDYFTEQWDQFQDLPWGVLAHSTHVRGQGTYRDGLERPRIRVVLATGLSREICERINLEYRDPRTIDPEQFADREDDGVLLVRKAGEHLYRLSEVASCG